MGTIKASLLTAKTKVKKKVEPREVTKESRLKLNEGKPRTEVATKYKMVLSLGKDKGACYPGSLPTPQAFQG